MESMVIEVKSNGVVSAKQRSNKRTPYKYQKKALENFDIIDEILSELHNRNLHISGLLKAEKVDIETEKVDIGSILSKKAKHFSVKTVVHIRRLFDMFGYDEVFGRSAVVELLEIQNSSASKFLSKLVQAEIIEPVSGHGKGKYKFRK